MNGRIEGQDHFLRLALEIKSPSHAVRNIHCTIRCYRQSSIQDLNKIEPVHALFANITLAFITASF